MIVKIISISLVSLIALFLIVINFNKRIAYKLYKIPKVHWLIKSLTFRNKEYLRESNFCMPHSVMPIIDDIGWAEGKDLRSINGPSRLITKSNPTLEDYERIVKIGKRNGIRIPAMMIISDFDHENICGQPHYNIPLKESNLTEQGVSWENHSSKDMSKDVMQLLQKNSAHVELGLHGVRHERFYENEMKNAEWADGETGRSWGDENTRLHCEVFSEILGGYFSKKECCFPESFVPPSHAFAFYSNDAKILSEFGVKYMCSSCATRPSMKFLRNSGTYHDGILMLDRTELNHVNKIAYAPKDIPINAFVGAHFPNFFGKAERNGIDFLEN